MLKSGYKSEGRGSGDDIFRRESLFTGEWVIDEGCSENIDSQQTLE